MTVFKDKDGNQISASEFCKGLKNVPHRWKKQAELEKPAPKQPKKKEVVSDGNTDTK